MREFVVLVVVASVHSMKLRSWLGPDSFVEGILPSAREAHGFQSMDDGKIFVFGGFGADGD